ncbi:hypothetical protein AGMMS49965_06060 [Bacteroidia bacterium]|nr:hypothetical protein AGMMS49965_06060 [Bacteroidia bacterium]
MKRSVGVLCFVMGTLSAFSQQNDAVYVERLSKLNNVIELPYNEVVRNCIDGYVTKRSEQVERMLGLADFYFPMIEEELDRNDLPLELKYLAVIESALNPNAQSRVRATGLWQFMLSTGKIYGLEINSLVDERRDPQKATVAACQYLKDMYRRYGDWTLAIASYNCGSGNVSKAIRRAGGKTDYWAIYPYLPRETRMYVPLFIAATYVMSYAGEHQIHAIAPEIPLDVDTIMVNRQIHFDQLAAVLNVDKEVIRMLNPQYKMEVIPGNSQPRALKLPSQHILAYIGQEDVVFNYCRNEIFFNRMYAGGFGAGSHTNGMIKKYHKVRKGQTLASIGKKYGVSAESIKQWNHLKSNKVATGKSLLIYTHDLPAPPASYLQIEAPTLAATNEAVPEEAVADSTDVEEEDGDPVLSEGLLAELEAEQTNTVSSEVYVDVKPTKLADETQPLTYKVKQGDSLYSIAQKYSGVSHKDLMKANKLKSPVLRVGQTIYIPEV